MNSQMIDDEKKGVAEEEKREGFQNQTRPFHGFKFCLHVHLSSAK